MDLHLREKRYGLGKRNVLGWFVTTQKMSELDKDSTILTRACPQIAFCKMCVPLCGGNITGIIGKS